MIRHLTRRQIAVDIAVPAAILAIFVVPAIAVSRLEPFVLAGICVALVFRRVATLACLGIAWFTAIGEMLLRVEPVGPSNILLVFVLYSTGVHREAVVRWLGFVSAFVGAALVSLYVAVVPAVASRDVSVSAIFSSAFTFSAALAGFLLAWTVGYLVRVGSRGRESRAAAARAEHEVIAEQERTRIARDMHDVVAHSLAVVIAQADGARYLRSTDPDAVDEALTTIAATSREALADVRVLLAQLRHDQGQAPQPAIADLDRLYEQFRAAGLELRIAATGDPLHAGTSAQLALYRIVQESLTNALRHSAPGAPVELRFDWTGGGVHVSVTSTPRDPSAAPNAGGHGLAGMTERAVLVGGHLAAGIEGDRFVVRGWIPVGAMTGAIALPVPTERPATEAL